MSDVESMDDPWEPGDVQGTDGLSADRVVVPVKRTYGLRRRVDRAVAIAGVIGIVVGIGLLNWQRISYESQIAAIDKKLASAEAAAGSNSFRMQDLNTRLAASEASQAVLVERNTQLAADLARVQAELDSKSERVAVTVTQRSVNPTTVLASNSLDLSAKVKGRATKVQMKIVGPIGSPDTQVFDLVRYSTAGGVDTWQLSVTAPWKPGEYQYFATAFVEDMKYEMAGDSGFTFIVK